MVEKDLIVTKVVAWIKHEKLVLFSVFQTNNSFSTIDHEDLMKHLTFANNYLISNINSATKLRDHLTEEILSRLLLLIHEKVTELGFKSAEKIRE